MCPLRGLPMSLNRPISEGGAPLWRPNGQLVEASPQKAQEATIVHARTTVADVKKIGGVERCSRLEQIQQVS